MAHVRRPRVANEPDVAVLLVCEERAAAGLDGPPETHDAALSKSAKKVTSKLSITAKPRIP
eukprot:9134993-Pyramimonas_sp.AAC.1